MCLGFLYFDVDLRTFYLKESEVIIEELQDDDSFEYSNMPALINPPSPIFLSNTQPPFIYQYVGEQVKILQVLGNFPFSASINNQTDNNTDHRDQKEGTSQEITCVSSVIKDTENTIDESKTKQEDTKINESNIVSDIPVASQQIDNNDDQSSANNEDIPFETALDDIGKEILEAASKEAVTVVLDERTDTTSLDTSVNDNDSAESDDEASFGTPEDSPKSKRKSPKGKYGKAKAPPPPPKVDTVEITTDHNKETSKPETDTNLKTATSQKSLNDIVNKLPNTSIKESGSPKSLQVVNPIAENKKRHKSKSPARIPKGSSSGIGKLLQLPGKLAFWKTEDKTKSDDTSTSSTADDHSRRSSTIEKEADGFQSCTELNTVGTDEIKEQDTNTVSQVEKTEDQLSFIDASALDDEGISQDIINKSDALQKLIEAKIAGHPEYKFISLHDEAPPSSKTTDV